jgi:pilus assembly protein Flp/PilA
MCCRGEVKAQAFRDSGGGLIRMIRKFLKDESGLELSEYAVAAALIALACVAAFQLLGTNIGLKINELAGKIQ